jgi:23S rRNA pseudouridine955/2504/2580 synthase/23S rRNA pseudouridine1911/1915/1917 synthase
MNNTIEILDIIYEDDFILLINKQSGVLSIPDRYNRVLPNLKAILEEKLPDVYVVHRLDRDTSGIIMFSKDAETHKALNQMFESHEIERIYHVLVQGQVQQDEINIDIPLLTDPTAKVGVIPSARGKQSLTILKVLKRFRHASLVECNLVTGRQHQIRAHVSAIGHPLLIDPLYGGGTEFLLSSIKKKFNIRTDVKENPIIARLSMHAYSLKFNHPENGNEIYYTAPYPKDFEVTIKLLEKYSAF